MDEITLLARAIPDEPPPSAETVARARARLTARHAEGRPPRRRWGRGRGRRWGWGWTAGAAVATAAVVMTVVLSVSNLTGVPEPAPPASPPPAFEQPPHAYEGLNRLSAATAPRSAAKVRLRFRPTSENVKIVIFCREPGSIFFTHEGTSGAAGVCGPDGGLSMLADKAYEPGWLGRDHQITVWVFPPDAPVVRGRGACPSKDACEGRHELSGPEAADRLAAELGERPGAWSVAAYDAG
ncbi:hypothetical protein Nocox_06705 [Nonomuraea coxensis DSM 45129]|uniref:Uncharacterized protein n=1 Tax=Nonomuraea coxensis DSM 45129 TaxID=1122611 RepID=A0ABX8TX94_9ACTN|nr:hypothetical protein [Nonomuraea coxensis]QYC38968.1 hypothetical protein Nocox_06705 [Nonomuraea coxensis DSM 45129]